MNILTTGSLGYLGSAWINDLLEKTDYKITAFDNLMYGQGILNKNIIQHPRVKFYQEDVRNWSDNLKRAIVNADVIVPFSAIVGFPCCEERYNDCWTTNYNWFKDLKKYLHKQVYINLNSNSAYGSSEEPVDENSKLNPLSNYAKSKQQTEDELKDYENFIGFRLATVMGVGKTNRPRLDLLVNSLTLKAVRLHRLEIFEGNFNRNFIHVNDIVNLLNFTISGKIPKSSIMNAGNSSCNCSKYDLAKIICKLTNSELVCKEDQKDPDKRNYIVKNDLLENTGFKPSIDIEETVKELIDYYQTLSPNLDTSPMLRNY